MLNLLTFLALTHSFVKFQHISQVILLSLNICTLLQVNDLPYVEFDRSNVVIQFIQVINATLMGLPLGGPDSFNDLEWIDLTLHKSLFYLIVFFSFNVDHHQLSI